MTSFFTPSEVMAVSLVTWSRVLSGICFLVSTSHVSGLDVGGDPISRPNRDLRPNATTIVNQQPIGLGGLVTKLEAYMLNTGDCIRLQVWRPATQSPTSGRGGTTTSSVTPTYPVSVSYWTLVGQTTDCVHGEIANQTFSYNIPTDQYIRVERSDVIGFSVRPNNPVPYTVDHTCLAWRHALTLERALYPDRLMSNIVYSFVSITECRSYSLKARIKHNECKKVIPISIPQNITFISRGVTSEDECWILEPLPSVGTSSAPTIIYLRYRALTFPGCNTGSVEIREGRSSTASLIQADCQMPNSLRAEVRPITTGSIYIRFKRRAGVGGQVTFTIQHSTERVIESICRDIVITENQVFIGSPNYPHHYPPNSNICWRLRVHDGESRIRVELGTGADLQPPVGCQQTERYNSCLDRNCKDFIEVRDGTERTSPLMTKWCDHTGHDLIETSSGQTMSVYFISDSAVQGTGFKIKTYSVHPETIQCSHYTALYVPAVVQSPYYPYQYPVDRDDCWSVRANDKNLRLLITVKDSHIEDDLVCSKDWVEVRDGPGSSAPLLRRWCGRTLPDPILTSGPFIFVRFVSNSMGRYPGFALSYVQVESEACTTYYAYPHREYLKPDFGQTATGYDIRCWVIRTEQGNMRVQWDSTGTGTDVTICGNTYVEIHDGDSMDSPKLGQYCDNSPIPPQGVMSTGSAIYIRWVSDVNTRPANFRLVYMSLSSTHCPLVFSAERPLYLSNPLPGMTTTSYPNYYRTTAKPALNRPQPVEPCKTCKYGPNQQTCWTVETERPNGRNLVSVRFVELQERDDRGHCKYDFLELRDGQSGDDPLLAMLCGSMEPTNFTSTSRWLFVRFQSDSQIELRGFRLEVKSLYDDECEVLVAQNYGNIVRSPYPAAYPPNTQRCWTIKSPSNQQPIKIVAILSNLDTDDVIEFYDGPTSEAPLLQKFDFHTKTGAQVISTASTMTVVLRTGPATTSRGRFDLRYNWLYAGMCNYLPISETATYLTTRDFGTKDYSSNDYGCWVLTVLDPQHTVEIFAEVFNLEQDSRCSADYLEIYDGPKNTDEKLLHRWCGQLSSQLIGRSSGRSLYVVFSSDNKNQYPGFKLKVMSKVTDSSTASEPEGGNSVLLNDRIVILVPVICLVVIVLIIVIIVVVCWGRKRAMAAQSDTPAPVVVYTNQPPAYTGPPAENGAVGRAPPDENKVALPDDFETESLPPPTPRVTADTSTLL